MKKQLANLYFKLRYGAQGVPISMGERQYHFDYQLRRWDFTGEEPVRQAIRQHLRPGMIAIDVGANFGMHALTMADLVGPEGRLIAFEPIEANLKLLERNLELNGFLKRSTIRQQAVSDLPDEYLLMWAESGLSPAATLAASANADLQSTDVKNGSLDEAVSDLSLDREVFVKIDVEGAELSVLRSALDLIKRIRPVFLIEVHDYALKDFGADVASVYEFLKSRGYAIQKITDNANHNGRHHHIVATPVN